MAAWAAMLTLVMCLYAGGALAQTVRPVPADGENCDLLNGSFPMSLVKPENLDRDGALTVQLYTEDRYAAEAVEALKSGDTVIVNGQKLKAATVENEEFGVYTVTAGKNGEEVLTFTAADEGGYLVHVGEWVPCTPLTEVTLSLPLPEDFWFLWGGGVDEIPYWGDEFLDLIREGEGANFTPYNAVIRFSEGRAAEIRYDDTLHGPDNDSQQ